MTQHAPTPIAGQAHPEVRDRRVLDDQIGHSIEAATPDADRLIARAQAGNERAATALYHHYFPHVYGYFLATFKNHTDAEDACQHVFLKVFEGLPRYQQGRDPFRSWLFTLVRNHAIDRLRLSRRTTATDPHELSHSRQRGETGDPPAATTGETGRIRTMLEGLPLPQRQALLLTYVHDLGASEAALLLGRSPGAIRQLRHRGLLALARTADRSTD
jgi:RNA polymerase sigma-70 factor (ECF subfamily)